MKFTPILYLFALILTPLANSAIEIENECVYKLECSSDSVTLNKLTDEELEYLIKGYEIIKKEKLTLEDYTYLHPRTRDFLISSAQLYDIELNALMIAQNEKLSIDTLMFYTEVSLHRLKYSFANDDTLKEQIQTFQADIGQAATGVITFGQFVRATEWAEITTPNKIYMRGTGEASEIATNYVYATGSWDILNENEAFPINSSDISCDKSNLRCIEEYKNYLTHEIKFGLMLPIESYILNEGTTFYDVISWTDEEILAKPNGVNNCRSVLLNINYITGKVQQIVNNNSGDCDLPKLKAPRVSELVDSNEFQSQYWLKLKNNVHCIKSKAYISKMQSFRAAMGGEKIKCETF